MSKRRVKSLKLSASGKAIVGSIDWASLGDDPLGELQVFAGTTSLEELRQRLRAEVETEVEAMLEAIDEFDAFDVIELIRLRELPIAPVAAILDGHDGSAAAIELISLVCLSRHARAPVRESEVRELSELQDAVSDLHARSMRLLRLGTMMHLASSEFASDRPLAALASEYQAYLVNVRKFQYDSVQVQHEEPLFGRPEIDVLVKEHLGFTFGEFTAVRSAIQSRYSRVLTGLRDKTGDIVRRCRIERREPTEQEISEFAESMSAFMFLPGRRASFTVSDIAGESELEADRVEAVIAAFSMGFGDEPDAAAAISSFLRGVNPLARASLIRDSAGNYLMTGREIGTDTFRMIAESALKPHARAWERYQRARTRVSETAAIVAVSRALGTPPAYSNLKYYAPKDGQDATLLGATCSSPQAVGDQTECDGLFLVQDVAVAVEVKGRTISDPARRGDRARLVKEVRTIFGEGTRQAQRLARLISQNHGLWLESGSWLDLAGIREIRPVVIGLDDFGPLTVALGDLKRADLLGEGDIPFIASLHDVDVISKVTDRPAEFLLYLRRRADSGITDYYRAADELDLFMLFLNGGLYVEPDPDEVRLLHPAAGPAKSSARKHHERDARPTIVGTHTDPLDAWMYWTEGTSPYEVAKPTFNTHPAAQKIVDFLADGHKPGWLRFGADLLGLAGKAQKEIGRSLRDLVDMSRADNEPHDFVCGFAGMWGYPALFASAKPQSRTRDQALQRLRTYMTAKKHQIGSDRSLGLLLDNHRQIISVIYMNDQPTDDPELDGLGDEIGLMPAGQSRGLPPANMRRMASKKRSNRKHKRRR